MVEPLLRSSFGVFVFYDVLISGVIGIIIWLVDRSSAGIIAFLLASILLLLIKLQSELERVTDELSSKLAEQHQTSQDVRTDVMRILEVDQAILKDETFFKAGASVTKSYAALIAKGDPFFINRAQTLLKAGRHDLKRLRFGEMYFGRETNFFAILRRLLESSQTSAFFTSYVSTEEFWFTGSGRAYHNYNIERARAGIQITRVFIVERPADITGEIRQLIEEQAKTENMHIRVAFADRLGRGALYDMGIFDRRYVAYLDLTTSREARGLRVFNTPEEVEHGEDMRDRFIDSSEDATLVLELD